MSVFQFWLDRLSLKNEDGLDEEYSNCGSYNSAVWDDSLYQYDIQNQSTSWTCCEEQPEQYEFYDFEFEEESLEQMHKEIDWSNRMVASEECFKNDKLADFPPDIKLRIFPKKQQKEKKQKINKQKHNVLFNRNNIFELSIQEKRQLTYLQKNNLQQKRKNIKKKKQKKKKKNN